MSPPIRRAQDKPGTVAIDRNITPTITIKINGNWLTRDYEDLTQTERKDGNQTIWSNFEVSDPTKSCAQQNFCNSARPSAAKSESPGLVKSNPFRVALTINR